MRLWNSNKTIWAWCNRNWSCRLCGGMIWRRLRVRSWKQSSNKGTKVGINEVTYRLVYVTVDSETIDCEVATVSLVSCWTCLVLWMSETIWDSEASSTIGEGDLGFRATFLTFFFRSLSWLRGPAFVLHSPPFLGLFPSSKAFCISGVSGLGLKICIFWYLLISSLFVGM